MSEYIGAGFLVLAFALLLRLLGLVERSLQVVATSKAALTELANPTIDEAQKEHSMRARSKALGRHFLALALGFTVALLAPVAAVWLLGAAGLLSFDAVMARATSWEFVLVAVVLIVIAWWLPGRR